jgi:hypothetical protein
MTVQYHFFLIYLFAWNPGQGGSFSSCIAPVHIFHSSKLPKLGCCYLVLLDPSGQAMTPKGRGELPKVLKEKI